MTKYTSMLMNMTFIPTFIPEATRASPRKKFLNEFENELCMELHDKALWN